MNPKLMAVLIASVAAALVLLACSSAYSSWVASQNHKNSCTSRGLILDTVHDIVQIAFTPPKGQTLTAEQATQLALVESRLYSRIDQARC